MPKTSVRFQEYKNLRINGPLSVKPIRAEQVKGEELLVFILMGPTGSGKSTFIESVSPKLPLNISNNSLEGVTQQVSCYRVLNLSSILDHTYILMDTPGFLDTKMSESRITTMITEELDALRQSVRLVYTFILYFQPITDVRIGGSKRDAIKLLRAFADAFKAKNLNVVTTMWNNVANGRQMDTAKYRLRSLEHKNDIFVRSDTLHINVSKFEYSQTSALSVLDGLWGGWAHDGDKSKNAGPQYHSLLRDNLLERITHMQHLLCLIADDRRNAIVRGKEVEDPCLLEIFRKEEAETMEALQSFSYDLCVLDPVAYQSAFPGTPFPPHPSPHVSPSPSPPPGQHVSLFSLLFKRSSPFVLLKVFSINK